MSASYSATDWNQPIFSMPIRLSARPMAAMVLAVTSTGTSQSQTISMSGSQVYSGTFRDSKLRRTSLGWSPSGRMRQW